MSDTITQNEINGILWRACDTFRGTVGPADYRNYMPVMLFVKYISDVWRDHREIRGALRWRRVTRGAVRVRVAAGIPAQVGRATPAVRTATGCIGRAGPGDPHDSHTA